MKTIERFELMNSVDLGYMINPITNDLVDFFKKLENQTQVDISKYDAETKKLLNGYSILFPDEANFIDCLDLNYININDTKFFIEDFERWLMHKHHWLERYQYAKEILKNK